MIRILFAASHALRVIPNVLLSSLFSAPSAAESSCFNPPSRAGSDRTCLKFEGATPGFTAASAALPPTLLPARKRLPPGLKASLLTMLSTWNRIDPVPGVQAEGRGFSFQSDFIPSTICKAHAPSASEPIELAACQPPEKVSVQCQTVHQISKKALSSRDRYSISP